MGAVNASKVDKWLEDDNLFLVECWARDGLTNADIAERMGINESTIKLWKDKYPEFAKAINTGKEIVDYKVENALLKSALGYKTKEVKTIINGKPDKDGNRTVRIETTEKEYAPNVTAIAMWLNNRKPSQWKRNRDNVMELDDKESNITVNIIKHGNNNEDEEWSVNTEKKKGNNSSKATSSNATQDSEDWDDGSWPDDWEE